MARNLVVRSPTMDLQLLDAGRVAQILGTTREVVYNVAWRERVGLPAVHIGRALRFRETDVIRLIERGRSSRGAEAEESTLSS